MAQAARQLAASAAQWHNHLPAWIREHEIFTANSRRNQTSRAVLQVIADACDPPNAAGDLMYAVGGRKMAARAGVHLGTFWRHVRRLEEAGLIVTLSRGGQLGNRNIANTYGIPGAPGSLDHRRARRRAQVMKRDGETPQGRPRFVPEIVVPGQQATMYPDPDLQQQVHQRRPHVGNPPHPPVGDQERPQPPPSKTDVAPLPPWRSATTPVAQRDATISIDQRPGHGNHGAARSGRRDGARSPRRQQRRKSQVNAFGGPCIEHIDSDEVLRDTAAMRRKYQAERRRGSVRMTELNWLSVAERALRVVREEEIKDGIRGSAAALFAAIVNRELWTFVDSAGVAHFEVSEVDEQRARQRMHAARSDEHVLVQAALDVNRRTGVDALNAIRSMRPGGDWTRERFDRIVAELRSAGAVP